MKENSVPLPDIPFRAVALVAPALAAVLLVLVFFFTLAQAQFLSITTLIVAYLLPPAGKETVIPIGIALGIPWWYMALAIVAVDMITGIFMALNFDIAFRIPRLGHLLLDLTNRTKEFLSSHPWFARLWFFAIVIMVMVPVFGSGGIRGSMAGKILGLSTSLTLLAILTGSVIGCFGMALGSDAVLSWLCANELLPAGIGAGVCGS